ncbi:MAG TPA: hypothetical protein VHZ26_09055 [Caulobacteraceae bacterium]|jgi:hypothetical protein|nr:hypothetical protein [Caulobacteraceae bacterium]
MADGNQPYNPANYLYDQAAQAGGPLAAGPIMHSQMLAEALANMRTSPPSIRTAGALGSNLLAEALMQWGQQRANQQLATETGQWQGQNAAAVARQMQGPDDTSPSASSDPTITTAPTSISNGASPGITSPNNLPSPPPSPDIGSRILHWASSLVDGGGAPAPPSVAPTQAVAPPAAAGPASTPASPQIAPSMATGAGGVPPPPAGQTASPVPQAPSPASQGAPGSAESPIVPAMAKAAGSDDGQPRLQESDFFRNFFVPHEGHINPADANGAMSVYGLNTAANPDVSAKTTLSQAQQKFYDRYWVPSGAVNMPPALAAAHADTFALNPSWANSILKQSGGDPAVYMQLRQQLMQRDQANNPAVRPYAQAWANRNRDLSSYMAQVGGQGQAGQTPAPVDLNSGAPAGSYQIASNGPVPPPPSGQGQASQAAAPMPQGGPQQPPLPAQAQPARAPVAPPHGQAATPYEMAQYRALISNPRTYQEGLAFGRQIAARANSMLDPDKPAWNSATGQWEAQPGNGQVPEPGMSTPDSMVVYSPAKGEYSAVRTTGGVQGNMGWDPATGRFDRDVGLGQRPLTSQAERAAQGISPADRTAYTISPDGKVSTAAADAFGPDKQLAYTAQVTGMEPYQSYQQVRGYWNAAQGLMKQPGGYSDLGLIDMAGKSVNPALSIRPNMIEQFGKERGFTDQVIGNLQSAMNHGGALSGDARNALMNTIYSQMQSHYQALQPILAKVDHDAQRFGLQREDLVPDLQPLPSPPPGSYPGTPAPQPSNAGPGQPRAGVNVAGSLAAARAAIVAGKDKGLVIQRLQAAGINPAGL